MTQSIRQSQFVYTYGPGAILEGQQGPRLILRPDLGLFRPNGLKPDDYEISDQRITQGLLGVGSRIFRLPSNSELSQPEIEPLYRTKAFPVWKLCLNTSGHSGTHSVIHSGKLCPVCNTSSTQEPIRFVRACPAGHLDDIDWYSVVHGSSQSCTHVQWFMWYGGGGSLSRVNLECPRCRSRVNFGSVYGNPWPCSGRYPEREPQLSQPLTYGCNMQARIIQRQASNLRIPELRTLFSIPYFTQLHRRLQTREIMAALRVRGQISSRQEFQDMLNALLNGGLISRPIVDDILQHSWEEILPAIQRVLAPVATRYRDLVREELHVLIDGSVNGIPPRTEHHTSRIIFEINPNDVRVFRGPWRRGLRVTPVRRLTTVTVQMGYRREVDTNVPARVVETYFQDRGDIWFPGVEFLGEGIFLMLDDNDGWQGGLNGTAASEWREAHQNSGSYPSYVFRGQVPDELHPGFVWWHTLSHLLIRSLSIEAGYSSASIRERVYVEFDGENYRGGVLLYATQPGSEGTMGGLIALAPRFEGILQIALDRLQSCSGDPLCIETRFERGHYNGAACYGCLLLPETSCEHRNMWLDRSVLRDNIP